MTRSSSSAVGPLPGQAGELEAAYRQHWPQILQICRSFLRDRYDAEDAMQETFARVAHSLETGGIKDLSAFLAEVARNVCRDEIRWRARRSGSAAPETASPVNLEDNVLDLVTLRGLWDHLGVRDRGLLADHLAGFSYSEMARRRGGTPKSISVKLAEAHRRARKFLRAAMGPSLLD